MGIRLPLLGVLDATSTDTGAASLLAGGIGINFKIPSDTDNVVVKFYPSVTAGGISATFQTTDDGGTTWYDVERTSIASNSGAFNAVGQNAQWLSIPTIGGTTRNVPTASLIATGSLVSGVFNGSSAASTLASGQSSGLPVLGLLNRIFLIQTGTVSANSSRVVVLANQQSNHS